jgi:hypothetical protein
MFFSLDIQDNLCCWMHALWSRSHSLAGRDMVHCHVHARHRLDLSTPLLGVSKPLAQEAPHSLVCAGKWMLSHTQQVLGWAG